MSIKCRNYMIFFCSAKNTFLQYVGLCSKRLTQFDFFLLVLVPVKCHAACLIISLVMIFSVDTEKHELTDLRTQSQQSFSAGCSIWTWLDRNAIFYLAFNLNVMFCKTIKIFLLKIGTKQFLERLNLKKNWERTGCKWRVLTLKEKIIICIHIYVFVWNV